MRFALANNKRVEANPELKGLCIGCGQPMIAICGPQRIWHWRHKAEQACDRWWETETNWHREWKEKFPHAWQEYIQHDEKTGEKHIADVRTDLGLIIEFQYSPLNAQERIARETFYKNIVWLVDGTRRKRDYPRLFKTNRSLIPTDQKDFFFVAMPEKYFPKDWIESTVPVLFDFRGVEPLYPEDKMHEFLWYLAPRRIQGFAVVVRLSHDAFVTMASGRQSLLPSKEIFAALTSELKETVKEAASKIISMDKKSTECNLGRDQAQRLVELRDRLVPSSSPIEKK